MTRLKKLIKTPLVFFFFIHFWLWTLVPLLRQSVPIDSIETVVWGRLGGMGNNKHPPLSGWFGEGAYNLFGGHDFAFYFLSQIFVLLGFIYIYKLARVMLQKRAAVLATMILEGCIYYGFTTAEYNVNVISLALWPMTAYYFYRAMAKNTLRYWVYVGVLVAANVLNKYMCGALFAGMGLYLICTPEGRAQFKHLGLYVSGAVALVCIIPHMIWLYETDFMAMAYMTARGSVETKYTALSHVIYPAKFLLSQAVAVLGVVILFLIGYLKSSKEKRPQETAQKRFLIFVGLLPLLIFAGISAFNGMYLKSMWGTPMVYALGIMLFYFRPYKITDKIFHRMQIGVYVVMGLLALALTVQILMSTSQKYAFPRDKFAHDISADWQNKNGAVPLAYVGGDIWYISNLALYQKDHPRAVVDTYGHPNPFVNIEDVRQKGIVFCAPSAEDVTYYKTGFDTPFDVQTYDFEVRNAFGKTQKYQMYYLIVPPQEGAHAKN